MHGKEKLILLMQAYEPESGEVGPLLEILAETLRWAAQEGGSLPTVSQEDAEIAGLREVGERVLSLWDGADRWRQELDGMLDFLTARTLADRAVVQTGLTPGAFCQPAPQPAQCAATDRRHVSAPMLRSADGECWYRCNIDQDTQRGRLEALQEDEKRAITALYLEGSFMAVELKGFPNLRKLELGRNVHYIARIEGCPQLKELVFHGKDCVIVSAALTSRPRLRALPGGSVQKVASDNGLEFIPYREA